MRPLSLAPLALSLSLLTGCGDLFGDKDAKQPGTALGTFHVTATQASNTCGDKALGAPATWEFDIKLSRDTGTLYWNNGATQIQGTLSDDTQAFAVTGQVEEDMRSVPVQGDESRTLLREAEHADRYQMVFRWETAENAVAWRVSDAHVALQPALGALHSGMEIVAYTKVA